MRAECAWPCAWPPGTGRARVAQSGVILCAPQSSQSGPCKASSHRQTPFLRTAVARGFLSSRSPIGRVFLRRLPVLRLARLGVSDSECGARASGVLVRAPQQPFPIGAGIVWERKAKRQPRLVCAAVWLCALLFALSEWPSGWCWTLVRNASVRQPSVTPARSGSAASL
jgi:hypothetical protein